MGSNGIEYLSNEVLEGGFNSHQQEKDITEMDNEELVTRGDRKFINEKLGLSSSSEVSSSPRRGLEHCTTAPVETRRSPLIADHEVMLSRSMTEKTPKHDLLLDRLSEDEKQQLIADLVRIQNDGTVEVDLERSASVASELLEFQSFDESTASENLIREAKTSIPRLQIAILVVGTRGDIQPFLAIAKRLQASSFPPILISFLSSETN
ncbi:hypothetical protein PIB30_020490 [Stylosanthes scabra]|uniref:Sterol 3-beta-glucosyltransferase n=1 Tax=Stylosanthes scabra TaxID=79078 RepID=A0ABU6W8G2_9FABA|nr:hypothetical protein [Stylosanthes scabra]